jgi:2-hydroxy-3-keto-5-methylthiopentenyl-1-phosphate phosphatase
MGADNGTRLVLDWDGTITEVDGLHMILEQFGDMRVFERMEGVLGDGLSLHEVIAAEIATLTLPLERAVEWVRENVTVRPGLHELAAERRPIVLSSGFVELIEPVLEREGVELEVLANRLDPRPDGWLPLWRDEAACAVCGEPCKRSVLAGAPYVYAGDGYSDRCAALAAERIFARDGLAAYLEQAGVSFEPFDDLADVARRLAA